MAMVRGIDVSAFQKTISWKAIKDAGLEFGFIKATEGTFYYVTSTTRGQRKSARRQGIPVGAYHFAASRLRRRARGEADHFLEVAAAARGRPAARPRPGDAAATPPTETAAGRTAGCGGREAASGQRPILYTFSAFAENHGRPRATASRRYPLWLANYGKNDGKVHPVRTVGAWPSHRDAPVHVQGPIAG